MSEHDSQQHSSHGERQEGSGRSLFILLFIIVVVLVVFGAITFLQRRSQYQALAKETETRSVPSVGVVHPIAEAPSEDLVLPGTMQAYTESPIYARTNGYLKKWYHDIGTRVQQGELLADIDTPEVDQQLAQARADLNTSKANANLSQITANRYNELLKTDGVSKQEADNANGDYEAKKATVQSSEANVRRLEELESFKHVYAPFTGVIIKRNVDIGNLINAGNGGATQLLFTLAQTDPLRVYVSVPESYSPSVRSGMVANLELTQYPGRKFEGKVVRNSEAIDPASRTLLTEVDVPNKSADLLPGGYAQVHLKAGVGTSRVQVPVNALLFRAEGLRAVVVDDQHKTHLRPLTIGRDFGLTLEVLSGLEPTDWIVINPADSLEDNQSVNVKQMQQPPAANTPNNGSGSGNGGGASNDKPKSGAQDQSGAKKN